MRLLYSLKFVGSYRSVFMYISDWTVVAFVFFGDLIVGKKSFLIGSCFVTPNFFILALVIPVFFS